MPRHKDLKSAAAGLLGSFIGRNNDVEGYWALGKLYSEALERGMREIEISLIPHVAHNLTLFDSLSERYSRILLRQCDGRCVPHSWIRSARVRIEFACGVPERHLTGWGDPFLCEVEIADDLGRIHALRGVGRCAPHDPAREMKRVQ